MNSREKELMAAEPLMKCANKTEFQHRLQWLSEGYLRIHMHLLYNQSADPREIEIYRKFKAGEPLA